MEPLLLLRGVREVAARANPDEPTKASPRAFDAAREHSADHSDLPAAKHVAECLRLPWAEVLAVAHAPEDRQAQLVGVKTKVSSSSDWLTGEHIAAVLGIVAARLGLDSLSLNKYRVERARILAENRRRVASGGELFLPTDEQIVSFAGSWDAALRLAGLRTTSERGPTGNTANSPTLVDLMERFYDVHGVQPTAQTLRQFARASGVPHPNMRGANVFSTALNGWRERRRAAGLPEPHVAQRRGGRGHKAPDYSREAGEALAGERRRDRWDRAACVAAVARYLAQLRPGERSTTRGYRAWASQQEHAPAIATIQLHGGWEAVRREAQENTRQHR